MPFFVKVVFHEGINYQAPLTVRTKITSVKNWLIECGIEFKENFWNNLDRQVKGSKPVILDKTPNKKELRQLLTHMRAKGRAFFLLLASSGMRIGEALQLKMDGITLNEDLVKIHIRREYTKSGNPRITFGSRESCEALGEWLKIREDHLQRSVKRSN